MLRGEVTTGHDSSIQRWHVYATLVTFQNLGNIYPTLHHACIFEMRHYARGPFCLGSMLMWEEFKRKLQNLNTFTFPNISDLLICHYLASLQFHDLVHLNQSQVSLQLCAVSCSLWVNHRFHCSFVLCLVHFESITGFTAALCCVLFTLSQS